MCQNLSDLLMLQLSDFVSKTVGLYFPKERWRDLKRGILNASQDLGFEDMESFVRSLLSDDLKKDRLEILADCLTIGETYFLRDKNVFSVLENKILPELIQTRQEKTLRIWSAGCCTGEEPYSIAMSVDKVIPDRQNWQIKILGTDLNERFLKRARKGEYTQWSLRDTPEQFKNQYFQESGNNRFNIAPRIKEMVNFSHLNLAEDSYPSYLNNTHRMDIIFCRNVLMYFSAELRAKAVDRFAQALVDKGWLVISPGEAEQAKFSGLMPVRFSGITLYRKNAQTKNNENDLSQEKNTTSFSFRAPQPNQKTFKPITTEFQVQPKVQLQAPEIEIKNKKEEKPSPKNLYKEAALLYKKGSYAEAADKLLQALSEDRENIKAISLLAKAYANQRKLAEAKKWCEKAISTEKLEPGHYYLLASICQEQGEWDESGKLLKQAIYLDHDFILAYFALGNLSQKQGRLPDAKKYLKIALSLMERMNPDEILPHSDGMTAGQLIPLVKTML